MADEKLSQIADEISNYNDANARIYGAEITTPKSVFALISKFVNTVLNQTIAGIKTFSDNVLINGQARGGYSVETFSATKTFNLDNGNSQEMVITGNITSLTLSNKVNGGSYLIYLVENGTGGYTIPTPDSTFGSKTDNSADFVTTANAINMINVNVRPNGTTYYTIETYTP